MPAPDPAAVARAHERGLGGALRRARGAWATPPALVAHLLDQVLEPALDEAGPGRAVTVVDPACGTGMFLVHAVRRIAARTGLSRRVVAERCVAGADVDAAALEQARALLWADAGGPGPPPPGWPAGRLHHGDALARPWDGDFDVVVGNPPYLSPLGTATAGDPAGRAAVRARWGRAVSAYTDTALVFALLATELARPDGGRVGLVLPQSLLSSRDAAGVRAALLADARLESLWLAGAPVFDAAVLTCAPTLRRGQPAGAGPVTLRRYLGPDLRRLPDRAVDPGELAGRATWGHLLADALGIPAATDPGPGSPDGPRLGDWARAAADFRDSYYALAPHVAERADRPDGAPLVTSGAIDPAVCRWGTRPARYARRAWDAPVVDLAGLDPDRAAWARARLAPKVLVAAQTRVVEAVVDVDGAWLPSVPVVRVEADADRLWHVAAALTSPLTSAWAAGTFLGSALSASALKLGARQVAAVPTPAPGHPAWDDAAEELRRAHACAGDDDRRRHLLAAGARMVAAAAVPRDAGREALAWWAARLG